MEAGTAAADRERLYLSVFIGTVGKLVPLVRQEVLSVALSERQRLPLDMATAVGADLVACEQAQVWGVRVKSGFGWAFSQVGVATTAKSSDSDYSTSNFFVTLSFHIVLWIL